MTTSHLQNLHNSVSKDINNYMKQYISDISLILLKEISNNNINNVKDITDIFNNYEQQDGILVGETREPIGCKYTLSRGVNKGSNCGKNTRSGNQYCTKHKKYEIKVVKKEEAKKVVKKEEAKKVVKKEEAKKVVKKEEAKKVVKKRGS